MVKSKYPVLLLTVALYMCGVFYYAVGVYREQERESLERIDNRLVSAARGAQVLLTDAYHQRIFAGNDIGEREFVETMQRLSEFADAAGVRYLYSIVKKGDAAVFASTSLTAEEWAKEGENVYEKNYLLAYDEATAELVKLFDAPQRIFEESQDQWGSFRSVLIPYGEGKNTYIVGADIEISDVMAKMEAVYWETVNTAAYYLGIIAPFLLAFLWMHKADKKRLKALVDMKTRELQKLNHRLEVRVREEVEKNREQERCNFQQSKLAQMGEMVSMIAHQWRQPLAAMSASASYMLIKYDLDEIEREDVRKTSELIVDQCRKMSDTITTFMNFVRPEQESRPFRVLHPLGAVMQMMQAQLAGRGIAVEVVHPEEEVVLNGNENLFEQVLINLLSNARDAFDTHEGQEKRITLRVSRENGGVVLSVEDNAGGIPEPIREKIFNPYFTSKEEGKGTGLGLYMSQDIMHKRFNGALEYQPVEGGSRFVMVCGI